MSERVIIGAWKRSIEAILPHRVGIKADQNVDRPEGQYFTLLVFGTRPIVARPAVGAVANGHNLDREHVTVCESTLSINFFRGEPWTDAETILAQMDLETMVEGLRPANIAIVGASGIRTIPETVEGRREQRAQLDLQFTHLVKATDTVPTVGTVTIGGDFAVDGGTPVETITHDIGG